jgi:arylsulfatase A-like enzyme
VSVFGYTTDLIAAKAVDFITRNKGGPFFIDVAFNAPHWPFQRPGTPSVAADDARFLKPADSLTSSRADYVTLVERMDRSVGQILAAIDRLGLARNTIVVFTNDNGGEWLSDNGPYFNRKFTTWEGGIRVPAIVRWPGRIPANTVTRQVGMTMDLTASVLAASGVAVPANARHDGVNLLPGLERRAAPAERTLFWRSTGLGRNMRAVRRGDLKLVVEGGHLFLFDVRRDPGERHDLARLRTADARALKLLLDAWERDVDAEASVRLGSREGAR